MKRPMLINMFSPKRTRNSWDLNELKTKHEIVGSLVGDKVVPVTAVGYLDNCQYLSQSDGFHHWWHAGTKSVLITKTK